MGLLTGLSWLLVKVFFSSLEVVNKENVPKDSPLLIVVNHNNQFVDAGVTVHAVPRKASFIIAEASMHRCIIGDLARLANSVPVVRPQDRAVSGKGQIIGLDMEKNIIIGNGTNFTADTILEKGAKLDIKGVFSFTVVEVLSDEEVSFKLQSGEAEELEAVAMKFSAETPLDYKMLPKVDQNDVYKEVHARLEAKGAIVIFPEGGSHDRPSLLPLKAGVAVMALGAIQSGVKDLKILPLGINYFHASVFRSNVLVEVGEAFNVPDEIFERYSEGDRRGAYQDVMKLVEAGMLDVTLNAPDYDTQRIMRVIRRLYQNGAEIGGAQYLELYRRFLRGYEQWKDNEEFAVLLGSVKSYLRRLDSLGLTDKIIENEPPNNSCITLWSTAFELLVTGFVLTVLLAIALPGIVLNYPLYFLVQRKVDAETKKALKKSKVKIKAFDVRASQKVINSIKFLPLCYFVNCVVFLLLLFFLYEQPNEDKDRSVFLEEMYWILPICLFFILPLYSLFMVRVLESAYHRIRLLPARFYTLSKSISRFCPTCCGGRKYFSPEADVRMQRRDLVIRTQDVVGMLTSADEEWQNDPIISEEVMLHRRAALTEQTVLMVTRKDTDHNLLSKRGDHEIDQVLLRSGGKSKRSKKSSS